MEIFTPLGVAIRSPDAWHGAGLRAHDHSEEKPSFIMEKGCPEGSLFVFTE